MDLNRSAVLKELLLRATRLSGDDRRAFLDDSCKDDPTLRGEIESILAHDQDTQSVLEDGSLLRFIPDTAAQPGRLTGQTISHYQVMDLLDTGGMGEVYRARDPRLARHVALKVISPGLLVDVDCLRRFEQEARAAGALNHPNVVVVYDVGRYDGSPYVVMELLEGESLRKRLQRGSVPVRKACELAIQVARGLAAAHEKGIVHRDVKPANLFVTRDGRVKLLDFGIAKLTRPDILNGTGGNAFSSGETGTGAILGTAGYMSPEQVRGEPTDHRSDLFALGAILYEMLSGRQAFPGSGSVESLHAILHDDPRSLTAENPEVPPALEAVVRRCLEKSPGERFQSCGDLAFALEALNASIVPSREEVADPGRATPRKSAGPLTITRTRVVAYGAGTLLLILAAVIVGRFVRPVRSVDLGKTAVASSVRIAALTRIGDVQSTAFSPDGRYLAYTRSTETRSNLQLLQIATGSEVELLPFQELGPLGLQFSPDGNYLYYLRTDPEDPTRESLFQIPSVGGPPRKRIYDVAGSPAQVARTGGSALTVSPDGKRICFHRTSLTPQGTPNSSLVIYDLEIDKERTLATVEAPESFSSPSWSPDGKRIAAALLTPTQPLVSHLEMIDVETGRRVPVGPSVDWWIFGLTWLPDGRTIAIAAGSRVYMYTQIWTLSLSGDRLRRVTGDWASYVSGLGGLSVSADGTRLVTPRSEETYNLWMVEASAGAQSRQLTYGTSGASQVEDLDLAEDGTVVFSSPKLEAGPGSAANGSQACPLWAIRDDGTGRKQLSQDGLYIRRPACLPHGGLLYEVQDAPVWRLMRADSDGGNPRRLAPGSGQTWLDVSPDGRSVLCYYKDHPHEIWAIPTDGGEAAQIVDAGFAFPDGGDPQALYSADGSRIAYQHHQVVEGEVRMDFRIIPANGGSPIATVSPPSQAFALQWDPNGGSLTYLDHARPTALFSQRIDGGEPVPILDFNDGEITGFSWSPDGSRVLVSRLADRTSNLWVVSREGTDPVQVTNFAMGVIPDARWARNGREIAYLYGWSMTDAVLISDFQ